MENRKAWECTYMVWKGDLVHVMSLDRAGENCSEGKENEC